MEEFVLSKVEVLLEQKKYAEAKNMLADLLRQDPNNPQYLTLLAELNLQLDDYAVAETLINQAIVQQPDNPHLFYVKSRIASLQNKFTDAETNIQQAIQLDPYDADYFAMAANFKLAKKDFEGALEQANQALAIDAENLLALNMRSTALTKLGRKDESFETIAYALRDDPNNSYTHSNFGWGLLEQGNHKKALEHFRIALKNDPSSEHAQSGMLEAIKATNPVYRAYLKYAFWIGNLQGKLQWGFIIGFYVTQKILKSLAENNPALSPYITPILIVLVLFAFSTWIINPVSNLLLRFHKFGRYLLDTHETKNANLIAICAATTLLSTLLFLIFKENGFIALAVFGFSMMLPSANFFSTLRYKNVLKVATLIIALFGSLAVVSTFVNGDLFSAFAGIYAVLFIVYQFVANKLIIDEQNGN
jgi:tetratricopeptide (TPR) repeat protein